MALTDYSTIPANNNTAPPVGAPEGMAAASVNNTMREMMANMKSGVGLTVNTTALMTALDVAKLADNNVISPTNRSTDGDGGGGDFFYDSSSSATANGGTIFAPDTGSGRFIRLFTGAVKTVWFDPATPSLQIGGAIDVVNAAGGGEVEIEPKALVMATTVEKTGLANITIIAHGAAIDCSSTSAGSTLPAGGGFALSGSNITWEGGKITGTNTTSITDSTKNNAHLLEFLDVNFGDIQHVEFVNGNGGGVELSGTTNNVLVAHNDFDKCNYWSSNTVQFGSIDIAGTANNNKIRDNKSRNAWAVFVSLRGTDNVDNYIGNNDHKANSNDTTLSNSAGVFSTAKPTGDFNLTIENNKFDNVAFECIEIVAFDTFNYNGINISNNRMSEWSFTGIILRRDSSASAVFLDQAVIDGNMIVGKTGGYAAPVNSFFLRFVRNSVITNNIIIGTDTTDQTGFNVDTCSSNRWSANEATGCSTGMNGVGQHSVSMGNTMRDCTTGFNYTSCDFGLVGMNKTENCTTGKTLGSSFTSCRFLPGQDGTDTSSDLPEFRVAMKSAAVTNVTGDGTAYEIVFDTEQFDRGLSASGTGNFDISTGRFNAPFNGQYAFSGSIRINGLTASHTSGVFQVQLGSRKFLVWQGSPFAAAQGGTILAINFSIITSVSATNNCSVFVDISGGAKVVDVDSNASGSFEDTWFAGRYLA